MANKDGIISIGFDYKKELEKMIREFESEMDSVSNNTNLSKGMKTQFDNIAAEMRKFKSDIEQELSNLGSGKVSQSSFKSFKQNVENKFKGIREDIDRLDLAVSTLNSSVDILGKGVDLSKISNDFKAFEDYVNKTNSAVEKLVDTLGEQGISLFSFDNRNITDFKNTIKQIDSALSTLDKDVGEKFELFDEKEAQNELNRLSVQLVSTLELMENAKKQMGSMDKSTDGFKKARADFASFQLQAATLNETIETLYETTESKGIYIEMDDKSLSMYEKYTDDLSDNLESIISYAETASKELSSLLVKQKAPSVKVSSEMNPNSAEFAGTITIETTSSELWEILSPIMDDLQKTLNSNPVVAPVKLVVAPTAVSAKETGNLDTSLNYSKKYQKVLAETSEDAVIDLEGVYKKTFTSIMDEAVSYAKETIAKIQNVFESSPIKLHFDFNEEEFKTLSNALLSGKSDKKLDITGEVSKAKKEVDNLVTSLGKVEEILSSTDNKKVSFKGFDKFAEDITKSLSALTELQSMLKALQNIEITLAKASGISSVTEIESQWENVSKLITNAVKLDGTFRKNANVNKLASEYSKYLDMGGSNKLSDIGKIKDNEEVISSILSKVKELNSQKVDINSVDKADEELKSVSSTLDGVISRLDHMINLTRDIGNTFYKMFKDASVSDIDKQWSSIENKFSSIADEIGKINLAKQKKDVQELMEMYQRYVNAGGMKSPFDLTDNTETIRKLNKVYEQLNSSKKDSSSVSKEGKSFDTVKKSVDSLTTAINTKTEAIKTEANTMELAARAEVKSIQKIIDALNPLIEKIQSIPELKIPKESDIVDSDKSNISLDNSATESLTNNKHTINEIGKTYLELLSIINSENKAIKAGNDFLGERIVLLKENKVIDGYIGERKHVNGAFEKSGDKIVHTHPENISGESFSVADIRSFIGEYLTNKVREFELIWKDQILNISLPDNLSDIDLSYLDHSYEALYNAVVAQLGKGLSPVPEEFATSFGKYVNSFFENIINNIGGSLSISKIDADGIINEIKLPKLDKSEYESIYTTLMRIKDIDWDKNYDEQIQSILSTTRPLVETTETLYKSLLNLYNLKDKTNISNNIKHIMPFLEDEDVRELTSILSDDLNDTELKDLANVVYNQLYTPFKQSREEALAVVDVIKNIGKISNSSSSKTTIEDVFQNDSDSTSIAKEEVSAMEQVESATEQAVQAKKDFATANEGVQDSVADSKSPLQLEAELMQQIAKDARDAADAKKEFVDANKQVKDSADDSNGSVKKKGSKNENQKTVDKTLTEQITAWKKIQTIREQIEKTDPKNEKRIAELEEIQEFYQKRYDASKSILDVHQDLYDVEKQTEQLKQIQLETDAKISKYNNDKISSKKDSLLKKINTYDNESKYTGDFVSRVRELQTKLTGINITNPEDIASLKKIEEEINDIISDSTLLENKLVKQDSKIADIISKMKIFRDSNTNMSKTQRAEIQTLIDYAENLEKTGEISADAMESIKIGFSGIKSQVKETGNSGLNLIDQIAQRAKDMNAKFFAQYFSVQDWIRYIRTGIQTVRELDTALTEMRKVSDESVESLKRYQATTFDVANEVGTTAVQIQNSTADFMRLGESMDEAAESSKAANILLNVSEFDSIDSATESLIAMSSAYKDLEKMDIIDVMNKIGNEYAISTDGIATALQDSASSLVTANNNLYEATALITAGNTVTQDPSKVGTGLRTIALRLTGTESAKEDLAEIGEDTDTMITSVSKLQETIKKATAAASSDGNGFDILDANGNYKSTYEIMKGLARLYDDIVAKDKELGTNNLNLLLETIAGKNRSNIAASILQNGDILESAFKDAQNADGSALEENEKYLDSIDGRQYCHVA